jgi:hypothetical protein
MPFDCTCLKKVRSDLLIPFLERSIEDARQMQKLFEAIDMKEYVKLEQEINEAEVFLITIQRLDCV